MKKVIQIVRFLFLISIALPLQAQQQLNTQNEELGKVQWYRDYDKAIAQAKKESKDVFILFQEVPGCATCRNFGKYVLSHPLMVEAIENEFIPLAIFNNKGGKDKEILSKYNEPSWNNPAVRIVNTEGRNVIPRIYGNYSSKALYKSMVKALESYGKTVPKYFELFGEELAAKGKAKEKHFQMYCFWSGEKQLGKVDGVLNTESGFMNHAEVVKITYDPNVLSETSLEKYAKKNSMKAVNYHSSYRIAKNDVHYFLRNTDFQYLPLSALQQTKINSALGSGKSGEAYLSPTQRNWLKTIVNTKSKNNNLLNADFKAAWRLMKKNKVLGNSSK